MNWLPVPIKGKLALGDSLTGHAAKFHKSCKLNFGNEKLDKAMKKFEKQEKSGNHPHDKLEVITSHFQVNMLHE